MVYDYAFYNDLGDPNYDLDDARPVHGGSSKFNIWWIFVIRPCFYCSNVVYELLIELSLFTIPRFESSLALINNLNIYVLRDERFRHIKLPRFLGLDWS